MPISPELRAAAMVSKAWPYEEARKLLKRYPDGPPSGGIVFETGYGPSGLPHLGTFQEVARTLLVRHALTELADWPSRLIAFSDDMDGMRKVPPGVPHQDMMREHLDQPLSRVPDPYGCGHASFADHNNNMLREFLDRFGFDYEFLASSRRLWLRPVRRNPEGRAAPLRRDSGGDAADSGRGAAQDLFAGAADQPGERQGAASAGRGARSRDRPGRVRG